MPECSRERVVRLTGSRPGHFVDGKGPNHLNFSAPFLPLLVGVATSAMKSEEYGKVCRQKGSITGEPVIVSPGCCGLEELSGLVAQVEDSA